jgi:hypothetical protein
MSDRYTIYQGTFLCHTCKAKTTTLRFYASSKRLTWVCNEKHLSEVDLNTKKTKRDYERKVRG